MLSHVRLFVTPWTVACWAPLSMRFFRKEYWSGLPFLSPGDLPDPGIESQCPALQAGSLPLSYLGSPFIPYFQLKFSSLVVKKRKTVLVHG